jgi:hypothetical protein
MEACTVYGSTASVTAHFFCALAADHAPAPAPGHGGGGAGDIFVRAAWDAVYSAVDARLE